MTIAEWSERCTIADLKVEKEGQEPRLRGPLETRKVKVTDSPLAPPDILTLYQ